MKRLHDDPALYARLRLGVRRRRQEFSSELWANRFAQHAVGLAKAHASRVSGRDGDSATKTDRSEVT